MEKLNAKDTLKYLIGVLEDRLAELEESYGSQFIEGQRIAYVECLEVVQRWEEAADCGLNYDIEERFPVN